MNLKTGIILFVVFLVVWVGVGIAMFSNDLIGSFSCDGLFHSNKTTTFTPITFTGSSDQTTDLFTVTTDTWVIEWSYTPEVTDYVNATGGIVRYTAQLTSLIFYVYPKGSSNDYYILSVFDLDPSKTSGSIDCSAGAGQYYIKVKCANISSWTITIKPA